MLTVLWQQRTFEAMPHALIALAATLLQSHVQTPPDSSADIVVKGRRQTARATMRETRIISTVQDGQLARMEEPLCPVAVGLPADQARVVENRIRELAANVGLRIAVGHCAPNLVVAIASDGAGFVSAMLKRRPNLFQSLDVPAIDRLRRSRGPSWTWQFTSPKRRDGGPVEMIDQLDLGNGPPIRVSRRAYIARNVDLSRITMPVRQDITVAFVVIDAARIEGLTLRQIADYATMTGIAPINTDRVSELADRSILALFDGEASERPSEATAFDLAYLRGMNSGGAGFSADAKTMQVAHQIDQALGSSRR